MFAVEWVLLSLRGRTIDFHQTTLNLTLGMMERLFALLSLGFGLRLLSVLLPFRLVDAIEPAWLNLSLRSLVSTCFGMPTIEFPIA
jgi:hypothetical protein